jgi:hypothetical protein
MTDEELIGQFAAIAVEFGNAVMDCEVARSNRAYLRKKVIVDTLRGRGEESRLRLVPLLNDKDRMVRYYAAQHLLGIVPELARPVIEENAKYWFDPIAADARGTLRMLDGGQYNPD